MHLSDIISGASDDPETRPVGLIDSRFKKKLFRHNLFQRQARAGLIGYTYIAFRSWLIEDSERISEQMSVERLLLQTETSTVTLY